MSSFEFNKVFAAILVAGILAMLGGFTADVLIHPHKLEKDAIAIDGAPVVAGAVAEAMPEPIMHLIATADITKGQKISKACAACHSFEKGGVNKVGPNMWGVVGRAKGQVSGFSYSEALMEKGGDWNYDSLNKFLWKPKKYIAGTKMNYIGLKKPEDRAAIIAWLKSMGSQGYALPSDAQIAAEKAELLPPEPEADETDADTSVEGAVSDAISELGDKADSAMNKATEAKTDAIDAVKSTTH